MCNVYMPGLPVNDHDYDDRKQRLLEIEKKIDQLAAPDSVQLRKLSAALRTSLRGIDRLLEVDRLAFEATIAKQLGCVL